MKTTLAACGVALLCSFGGAQAAPQALGAMAPVSPIQNIDWRRVCDRDGDNCHRVFVRDRDDRGMRDRDRDHDGMRRVCDRDGDNCHWMRR